MNRALAALVIAAAPGAAGAEEPPGSGGWTLRAVPDSTPVALGEGPGNLASLAVFCLSGEPFLAAVFREPPGSETARFDFAFSAGPRGGAARREAGAGGAYVIALRGTALAEGLAGRDGDVAVSVDGADLGILSLRGSSAAIRAALADCLPI